MTEITSYFAGLITMLFAVAFLLALREMRRQKFWLLHLVLANILIFPWFIVFHRFNGGRAFYSERLIVKKYIEFIDHLNMATKKHCSFFICDAEFFIWTAALHNIDQIIQDNNDFSVAERVNAGEIIALEFDEYKPIRVFN